MKVTVWRVFDKKTSTASHHHIEDGWVEGDFPQPQSKEYTSQKAWKNHEWEKVFAELVNGKVVNKITS